MKKNHFIFDPVQNRETNLNFTGCQMPHFMIVLIPYQFINLSWIKKMSILKEHGAFSKQKLSYGIFHSISYISPRIPIQPEGLRVKG